MNQELIPIIHVGLILMSVVMLSATIAFIHEVWQTYKAKRNKK